MAEVRGEGEDPAVDVRALPVPAQEAPGGERVPQVVHAGQACAPIAGPTQSRSQLDQGDLDGAKREMWPLRSVRKKHSEGGLRRSRSLA